MITPRARIRAIIRIVARAADVRVDEIMGKSRARSISMARGVAQYALVQHMKLGRSAVGRIMQCDHSSVSVAVRRIELAIGDPRDPRAALYARVKAHIETAVVGDIVDEETTTLPSRAAGELRDYIICHT